MAPTPEAQAAFDDYERRWLLMSTWGTVGPVTQRYYSFWTMPQFKHRWDFWLPWALAWKHGTKDVTMLVAQRSNLNGAELDAKHENAIMSAFNAKQAAKSPPGTQMILIPLYGGESLTAPGVASSTQALQAAAEVDRLAKEHADHFAEGGAADKGISTFALLVGLGLVAYLVTRD